MKLVLWVMVLLQSKKLHMLSKLQNDSMRQTAKMSNQWPICPFPMEEIRESEYMIQQIEYRLFIS